MAELTAEVLVLNDLKFRVVHFAQDGERRAVENKDFSDVLRIPEARRLETKSPSWKGAPTA